MRVASPLPCTVRPAAAQSRLAPPARRVPPPPVRSLIFAGKAMNDDKMAKDYNIEGGSVLHLVLALRGGAAC